MRPLLLTACLCLATVSCETRRWELYATHLKVVKSLAAPGKDIRAAKRDLEERGYEATDPYDPFKSGEVLWMNVDYGAAVGFRDGIRYAAELPDHGPPGSILVEADPSGTIREVREAGR